MKLCVAILPLALALHHPASAFAPLMLRPRPVVLGVSLSKSSTLPLHMSDEDEEVMEAPPAPAPVAAPAGALVAINQENIEFTAGVLGAVLGLLVGGPYLAAIGAAAANLASKAEGNVVGTISKSGIEVLNTLIGFNAQYGVLDKAGTAVSGAVDKLKTSDAVDQESFAKIEEALGKAKAKVTEVNDEYDLVGAVMTALGVVGDVVEKTAKTAGELNEQYQLTSKAKDALDASISKAGASESFAEVTAFVNEKKEALTDKLSEVGIEIPSAEEEEEE